MSTILFKFCLISCLFQQKQANMTVSSKDILTPQTDVKYHKKFMYYVAGGERDPELFKFTKHMVSIRTRKPLMYFGDNHFCGGAIISKKAVLTSGNCVMDKRRVLTRSRRMLIVAGTPNRLEPIETTVQFPVQSIVANTNFVRNNKNDIAIIHLKHEIPEDNENIRIIKMPSGPPVPNASCTVLGWGRMLFKGPFSALSFHVNVRIQEPGECKNFLKEFYYDGVLCAVGNTENGPCLGDTGGPLICNEELTGIVSYTMGCKYKNAPSLYTDVWHHRKWIEVHLNTGAIAQVHNNIFVISIAVFILK